LQAFSKKNGCSSYKPETAVEPDEARFVDESPFSRTVEVIENEGNRKPRFSIDAAEKSRDGLFQHPEPGAAKRRFDRFTC
jgi:hypothetical protein